MDESQIPEDMTAVAARVQMMTDRGFPVSTDDVIKETLKAGLQAIVDERMEGNYYYVRWDEKFWGLDVLDLVDELVGQVQPISEQDNFIDQFKENADQVWFYFDKAAGNFIGR
ncbi:hypothetical protein WOSG25_011940 [Weissella oryzae SG25]|uniref:Uncharacterized protein n=1 Tax=Weissella oryzae (strain DSM 25784 / JCM 18191 / LMG 30913 / SG25) TaxID=1329250 RepID=A0A069CRU0_WEIOS|nr:hypothetical protein [Weissella oryzae]GAK30097.1 hypothetical protein WOSG25_011940 [Weissella oryzae SG25]